MYSSTLEIAAHLWANTISQSHCMMGNIVRPFIKDQSIDQCWVGVHSIFVPEAVHRQVVARNLPCFGSHRWWASWPLSTNWQWQMCSHHICHLSTQVLSSLNLMQPFLPVPLVFKANMMHDGPPISAHKTILFLSLNRNDGLCATHSASFKEIPPSWRFNLHACSCQITETSLCYLYLSFFWWDSPSTLPSHLGRDMHMPSAPIWKLPAFKLPDSQVHALRACSSSRVERWSFNK